jgi:hypothetical protein
MMTQKELLQMDTLRSQLAAERKHGEQVTKAYRENLYELVDCKIKLDRIMKVLQGDE